jgi:predicted HicB family RNase H-like nuclease
MKQTEQLVIRIPAALKRALVQAKRREKSTLNAIVTHAIEKAIAPTARRSPERAVVTPPERKA